MASVRPPVCSSNTRMNSSPIVLRFSSGSITPAERSKKRSRGVDVDQLDALVALERLHHLSRSRPCGAARCPRTRRSAGARRPGARGRRPPTSRHLQTTRRSPARRRPGPARRPPGSSMIDVIVHVGWQPQTSIQEAAQQGLAVGRVHDLGVELDAVDPARPRAPARRRAASGVLAVTVKPSGARTIESKWLIHTTWCSGSSRSERLSGRRERRCGRTRRARCGRPRRRAAGR